MTEPTNGCDVAWEGGKRKIMAMDDTPPKIAEDVELAQAQQPQGKKPYKKTLPRKQRKPRKKRVLKGKGRKY